MKRLLISCAFLALAFLTGCETLPEVQVCYEHPEYGAICIKYDGKKFVNTSVPADVLANYDIDEK